MGCDEQNMEKDSLNVLHLFLQIVASAMVKGLSFSPFPPSQRKKQKKLPHRKFSIDKRMILKLYVI